MAFVLSQSIQDLAELGFAERMCTNSSYPFKVPHLVNFNLHPTFPGASRGALWHIYAYLVRFKFFERILSAEEK